MLWRSLPGFSGIVLRFAAKVVYLSGVERVIKSFEPYKVPGTDGIYSI
jgi:hypothetical protein